MNIERIEQMEARLDRVRAAVDALKAAHEALDAVKDDAAALDAYYGSEAWRQDLADDEAGLLPAGLKRGVLSEDGVWNALEDFREVTGSGQKG